MHPNYAFMLAYAADHARGPIRDYGCGAGAVVVEGRRRGLDIEGAEVFYAGGSGRDAVAAAGLLGTAVLEIEDGRVPVEDGRYDLVLSNQVFEHVDDLDATLREIERILRPGGSLLSMFPSRDVWREGHCGIPFLHRFEPDSRLAYHYARGMRRLGFGSFTEGKAPDEWAANFIAWIDSYCFYRSYEEIERTYRRYFSELKPLEDEHASFRLRARFGPAAERALRVPGARRLTRFSARKLLHLTFLAVKARAA
jgi:SAM-dependent methyltransferase